MAPAPLEDVEELVDEEDVDPDDDDEDEEPDPDEDDEDELAVPGHPWHAS